MRTPAFRLASLGVTSIIMSAAAPLASQAGTDSTSRPTLPPIIVTATKVPIAAVTASTTVLRGDELRRQGIITLGAALQLVPSLAVVQTSSMGTRTSVYTRGGESGYTRVLVDGVAVNDPGGEYDYANLTIDDVDRIEVIRGPSSVLYGTDAVSGVIQVFTRHGRGPVRIEGEARAGSFGSRAVHSAVSAGGGETGYRIGVGHTQTDGIHAFNSAYSQTFINGTGRASRPDIGDIAIALHYSDAKVQVPTNGSGAVVDRNAFQSGERVTVGVDLGRQLADRVEARLLLAEHRTDGGFTDRPDDIADSVGFFAQTNVDHVSRRSADFRFNVTVARNTVVTVGGLAEQQQQRGTLDTDSEFGPFSSTTDVDRVTRAGYVQLVGAASFIAWNAGARIDHSSVFGTFGTWRGGVAITASPTTRLRRRGRNSLPRTDLLPELCHGLRGRESRPSPGTGNELGDRYRPVRCRTHGAVPCHLVCTAVHGSDRIFIRYRSVGPELFQCRWCRGPWPRARGIGDAVRAGSRRPRFHLATHRSHGCGSRRHAHRLLPRRRGTAAAPSAQRRSWRLLDAAVTAPGFGCRQCTRAAREDLDYAANARAVLPAVTTVDLSANAAVRRPSAGHPGLSVTARLSNALDERYESVLGFRSPGRAFTIGLGIH